MCGCTSDTKGSTTKVEQTPDTLVLKVEDMTCGHCASTIAKALEAGLPGAEVHADPGTKLVSIKGARHPRDIVTLIRNAGYTPTCAPLG
jgi:copper chaperone